MKISHLFSCEHATCAVPEAQRELFRGEQETLESPQGWEAGALNLAQNFAMKFRTPLVHGDITRLIIDLEQDGDARWSRFTEKLPVTTLGKLADRHERPYRAALRQRTDNDLQRHDVVLHVFVHATGDHDGRMHCYTPPHMTAAGRIARNWTNAATAAGLDARHDDAWEMHALAKALATDRPPDRYAPLKLEVSRGFFLEGKPLRWETLKNLLVTTLEKTTAGLADELC